jgi:hypothetical protein
MFQAASRFTPLVAVQVDPQLIQKPVHDFLHPIIRGVTAYVKRLRFCFVYSLRSWVAVGGFTNLKHLYLQVKEKCGCMTGGPAPVIHPALP